MRLRTIEIANSLLSRIKKIDLSIEKFQKISTTPDKLNLSIAGQGTVTVSHDIKVSVIADTIKTLGIQKAQLQAQFDELEDIQVEQDEE